MLFASGSVLLETTFDSELFPEVRVSDLTKLDELFSWDGYICMCDLGLPGCLKWIKTCQPQLHPRDPHGGKREPISANCPLTSIQVLWQAGV